MALGARRLRNRIDFALRGNLGSQFPGRRIGFAGESGMLIPFQDHMTHDAIERPVDGL